MHYITVLCIISTRILFVKTNILQILQVHVNSWLQQ